MNNAELEAVQTRYNTALNPRTDLEKQFAVLTSLYDIPNLLKYIKVLKTEVADIDANSAAKDREYRNSLKRLEADRDSLRKRCEALENEYSVILDTIRHRLHGLSYESIEWPHGEHARVVELAEIDELMDEFGEARFAKGDDGGG